MGLQVLIAGGGLGGLCLAQGLRQDGIRVAVYEREPFADTSQGYRIHINRQGSRALHACLPPPLWESFVRTAGRPCAGLGFLTEQMDELLFIEQRRVEGKHAGAPFDPATSEHPVSRVALRQVLLGGLGDIVNFGKALVRCEIHPDSVTAHFADGSTAQGDLLVAADGIGSRIRQQVLPQAKVVDTGMVAVGGQLPVDAVSRGWLPEPFLTRLNNVIPPRGCGMFIAQYLRKPEAHPPETRDSSQVAPRTADGLRDHVFWAFVAKREAYTAGSLSGRATGLPLQAAVLGMIDGWHPHLVRLVRDSDPDTVAAFRIQSSEPIERWDTTRVTLLGDAIHAMTPLQGLGGNTALRDAALLRSRLNEVDRGQCELLAAISLYEQEMIDYGFDAVRLSRRVGELAVSDDRIGRSIFKTVLRVADRIPPLKQRMFGARS